ncbi:hypothetical protein H6G36_06670 [Anabaena minutissima FACHB-250]|nr:hypothetical protein [Anabaena minutissima FACHB-250]
MSSIVISDLKQESILTDLSDEQINHIQGGLIGASIVISVVIVATAIYVRGYKDGANSCA